MVAPFPGQQGGQHHQREGAEEDMRMWLQLKKREALEDSKQRSDTVKCRVGKDPSGCCWGKA